MTVKSSLLSLFGLSMILVACTVTIPAEPAAVREPSAVEPVSEKPEAPPTAEALPLPHPIRLAPDGFTIGIYADDVPNARSMVLSPEGTLFVSTRQNGSVYAVLDHDQDQQADEVITLAQGLNMPNGVAFREGALYLAEVNRVWRYDDIEADLHNPPEPALVSRCLPPRPASRLEVHSFWAGWQAVCAGRRAPVTSATPTTASTAPSAA